MRKTQLTQLLTVKYQSQQDEIIYTDEFSALKGALSLFYEISHTESKTEKSNKRNAFAHSGHAAIRKNSGLLTSRASKLPGQPLSPAERPSKNTQAC